MNKIFITKLFVISVGFVLCTIEPALANISVKAENKARVVTNAATDQQLEQRIQNLNSIMDLRYTATVEKQIRMYTEHYPRGSEALLGRVSIYFPLIEQKIREKNLPDELKYLTIIESSLRPKARSHMGAVGLWQFMRGTARMYGLKINRSVDERRDPYQSTDAALEYLSDLHKQFGDWTLAIAAYNCGPGNVMKAMKRSNGATFWEIRGFLPKETREYVPKFIAASYLMHYYHMHNIIPKQPDDELKYTAMAKVFDTMYFDDISTKTGVSLKTIKQLNPAFLRNYIPKSNGRYLLTLPESKMYDYLQSHSSFEHLIYGGQQFSYRSDQSLSERLGFRSRDIYAIDNLPLIHRYSITLQARDNIPKPGNLPGLDELYFSPDRRRGMFEYHKLGLTESLFDFAKKHENVELEDLVEWNEIDLQDPPSPGSMIRVKVLE